MEMKSFMAPNIQHTMTSLICCYNTEEARMPMYVWFSQ